MVTGMRLIPICFFLVVKPSIRLKYCPAWTLTFFDTHLHLWSVSMGFQTRDTIKCNDFVGSVFKRYTICFIHSMKIADVLAICAKQQRPGLLEVLTSIRFWKLSSHKDGSLVLSIAYLKIYPWKYWLYNEKESARMANQDCWILTLKLFFSLQKLFFISLFPQVGMQCKHSIGWRQAQHQG